MKKRLLGIIIDYTVITLSCLLYAFSFNCFFDTNSLAMGGFTGISQVLNRFIPALPVGVTVFSMNVPLMMIGIKKQGVSILFTTLYATAVSSLFIDILSLFARFPATDPLLAALFGGVLMGISLGLMLQKNATTGGTELAAKLLKYIFRNIPIGKICLFIDVAVICLYSLFFGNFDTALYGIIAMYVSSQAMDMVIYGSFNAKLLYIISDKSSEITDMLLKKELGVTVINGKGAFTGTPKQVILCAVKPSKVSMIKSLVTSIDPDKSIIIVTDAREVYGEGFEKYTENSF